MRIGIVGTHWGRVHCGTFRRFGHEIAVLVARDPNDVRRVADQEGVAIGTTDVDALESVDLIVIASPTPSHAEYIRRFMHKAIVCEKPLFGTHAPADAESLAQHPRLWLNYAFGFAAHARALRDRIGALGELRRARIGVDVDLGEHRPASHWLEEIAVHPLSFAVHLLGGPTETELTLGSSAPSESHDGARTVEVRIGAAHAPGIDIDLHLEGSLCSAQLSAAYRVGSAWRYELSIAGERIDVHQSGDAWFEANCACIGALLDAIEGRTSREEARARGAYDGRAAVELEALLSRP